MTANERTRVLEMVAKGTISIEQADQLLEALENTRGTAREETTEAPASDEESWRRFGRDWARNAQQWGRLGRAFGRGFGQPPEPPHPPFGPRPPRPPRAPKGVGGGKLSFEQMIELGKFGISANYLRQLGDAGLSDLSFEEIIELGKFGIDANYVIELRKLADELQSGELTVDRIIELGKFGVNPENVREMLQGGLFDLGHTGSREAARLERRRARLEQKLARVHAKLEATNGQREERKLREMAQELQDEIDELETVHLEAEIEADDELHELQADAPQTEREP